MTRTVMFGPPVTFLGVPEADLDDAGQPGRRGCRRDLGAPFDGGTSHRAGVPVRAPGRCGPPTTCPTTGAGPHLALGVDPLVELGVVDVGDVEMPPGEMETVPRHGSEQAVATVAAAGAMPVDPGRGPHHRPARRDRGGPRLGWGEVSVIHFDAHADTGDTQFGSLLRPRHADAPSHRVGRGPRRPVPPDRARGLLARARDPGLDGRAAGCAATR